MHGSAQRVRKLAGTRIYLLLAAMAMRSAVAAAAAATSPCNAAVQSASPIGQWEVNLGAAGGSALTLTLPANRSILLETREDGVDVEIEASTSTTAVLRSANPTRRFGLLRLLLRTDSSGRASVNVRAAADGGPGSHVTLRAYNNEPSHDNACSAVTEALADGDAAFAQARMIHEGRATSNGGSVAQLYDSAYRSYVRAFVGLAPENRIPRAEIALAVATLLGDRLERWREGERWAALAARLLRQIGNAEGRASAETFQALAWMQLAQLPDAATAADPIRRDSDALAHQAVQQFQRLATFYEDRHEPFDAAEQHNLAGLTLYNQGQYTAALASYARARQLYEKLGERYRLALVIQNIGLVEWDLGRSSAALNSYRRALSLVDAAEFPSVNALILNNAGLANRTAGRLDTALTLHTQALDLSSRIQNIGERGRSLFGIGMVYSAAGDRAQAADFLRQAIDIFTHDGEGRDLVGALRASAMIAAQEGHHEEAIRLDRQALASATSPIVRTHLLAQIADSESLSGQARAAADDLTLARKLPPPGDAVSRALVQLQGGLLDYRAGHWISARAQLRAALATDRGFGLDAAAFEADVGLARVDMAAGDPAQAQRDLDAGLALSEALRVQVSNPELRATTMQPLRPAFDLKIDLLANDYRQAQGAGDRGGAERAARAALAVAERSRSRVMRDIALADYTRVSQARADSLLSRKSQLLDDIAAHEDRLEAGGVRSLTDPRVAAIRTDVAHLREQLAVLDSQLAILSRSGQKASEAHSAAYVLPADVAIVSYWLGAAHAYAWLHTQSQVQLVDLGSADGVRAAAEADHRAYSSPDGASLEQRQQAGAGLSRLVLQPLLAQIPAQVTRLIIVPDGALHYVSFAALPLRAETDDSFLVEKYEVAYGSSVASLLATRSRPPSTDGMLLVADAVYGSDDPRLSHAAPPAAALTAGTPRLRSALNLTALQRLPATAAEASGIEKLAAPLGVDELEGFAATRAAVLSRPLERYRYIHFAVHATTDAEIPQMSSLVLSTHGTNGRPLENRIWAGDLLGRRFNARTIVLSACDTALGRDMGGDGLFSLRYVVLARGAQSVIASLWAVPDRSTATLMQSFYKALLQENRRPETALTIAQRQMLQQGPRDPAFWAPFTATIASLY